MNQKKFLLMNCSKGRQAQNFILHYQIHMLPITQLKLIMLKLLMTFQYY